MILGVRVLLLLALLAAAAGTASGDLCHVRLPCGFTCRGLRGEFRERRGRLGSRLLHLLEVRLRHPGLRLGILAATLREDEIAENDDVSPRGRDAHRLWHAPHERERRAAEHEDHRTGDVEEDRLFRLQRLGDPPAALGDRVGDRRRLPRGELHCQTLHSKQHL